MNPEYINTIALWVGFAALGALVLLILGLAYLAVYEIAKVALQRILFPLWFYHVVTTIARLRCYRPSKNTKPEDARSLVVRFIFQEARALEARHPEMRGLIKELTR